MLAELADFLKWICYSKKVGAKILTGGDVSMKIEEVRRKYKDEWVLVEVLEEDELGNLREARVIAHSKNRDDLYRVLKGTRAKYTYQFYTGRIPRKGYAVAFYG